MAKNELTVQGIKEGGLLTLGVTIFGIGSPMLMNDATRNIGLGLVAIGTIVILAREAIKSN